MLHINTDTFAIYGDDSQTAHNACTISVYTLRERHKAETSRVSAPPPSTPCKQGSLFAYVTPLTQ